MRNRVVVLSVIYAVIIAVQPLPAQRVAVMYVQLDRRICSEYSGANAGAQIAACIAAIPSGGGIADASTILSGTWSTNPCSGVTKQVILYMANNSFTIPSSLSCPTNVRIVADPFSTFSISNGATLRLGCFSGSLDQHFRYSGAGTALFTSASCTKETYPEWFGAKADNSTPSLDGLYNSSRAVPSHGRLVLQSGTYLVGSTATKPCMWPQNDDVEIAGSGQDVSIIRFTSSYRNSNVLGGCLFFGDQANSYATTRSHLYIHDFGIFDSNTGGAFNFAGINPSCFSAVMVSDIAVEKMHFKDCKGNAAVTVVGNNAAHNDNGENLQVNHNFFEGTSAGGYIEFAATNTSGFTTGEMVGNRIVGASIAGVSFNDGSTKSEPHGIVLADNFIDFLSRGNNDASCLSMGPGRGLRIYHNTCLGLAANQIGIAIKQETSNFTNKQYDLSIEGNTVYATSFSSTIGISIASHEANGVHVEGNSIRAVIPFTGDLRADADANGPGLKSVEFVRNRIDCGSTNCTVYGVTQSTGTVTLSTGTQVSVHNNVMTNVGGEGHLIDFTSAPTLKSGRVRVYDNEWDSPARPRNNHLGMPYFALGFAAVSAGGTGSVDINPYYGALPGDEITVVGLNDGSGFTAIPTGVTITGTVTTNDVVEIVVTNQSGSTFTPTGGNTPLIIGQRRR